MFAETTFETFGIRSSNVSRLVRKTPPVSLAEGLHPNSPQSYGEGHIAKQSKYYTNNSEWFW